MATSHPMGIGVVGQPDVTFKQEFRWTFEISGFCNNAKNVVPEYFVNLASRPNLEIEEVEINHLNAKTWIPGKASWQTIQVEYLDTTHSEMQNLWNWLATIYNFTDPINLTMGSKIDWNATGVLTMYDGCGTPLETWQLQHMFPTSVDFGEVDYKSSEICKIGLTLRYSDVIYTSLCPSFTPTACCTACK